MSRLLRVQVSCALLILLCYPAGGYGQAAPEPSDTLFHNYIREAWDEIRKTQVKGQFSDTLQNRYAAEFFRYHREHPVSVTGLEAGWLAFMMWSNTANVEAADRAIAALGTDSKLYGRVMNYLKNIYYSHEGKGEQAYYDLLVRFKKSLIDSGSRSAVFYQLGEHYVSNGQLENAQQHFREVIRLDANSFLVDQAIGELYEMESLQIGEKAPGFTTQTVRGEEISLQDYQGKIVLLEFWATWCGPCMPEIPHLQALQKRFGESELKIIGVALNENPDEVTDFIGEREMEWTQILQPGSWNDEITGQYNVSGIPRSYIIGREGTIVGKDLRGEELKETIIRLISR